MSLRNTKDRREILYDNADMAEELKITDNFKDKEKTSCETDIVKRLRDNFHAASKTSRKQMNTLRCKLVNDRNVETLEQGAHGLSIRMKKLTRAQDELENAMESTAERMALYAKFEDISHETNMILKEVEAAMFVLRRNDDNCVSTTSSRRTRKTAKSKSSRRSVTSSTSTARERRLNLEEEFATLIKGETRYGSC